MKNITKPKLKDIIEAFTNELEVKFDQLEAIERRLKESQYQAFERQERLAELIEKERVEIKNTKAKVDLNPLEEWEESFQNSLSQNMAIVRRIFENQESDFVSFYKTNRIISGISMGLLIITVIVLGFMLRNHNTTKLELHTLKEKNEILKSSNEELLELIESEN